MLVINCEPNVTKNRAKNWISQIHKDSPSKHLLVSACADATKVPEMVNSLTNTMHRLVGNIPITVLMPDNMMKTS